ncbi:hypothetical protein F5141DRAFT_1080735 [Pisolithus sp. B1]|nr:hypothetical protein F5141DRAFT_1080735 [Pisolithus sp. B1]
MIYHLISFSLSTTTEGSSTASLTLCLLQWTAASFVLYHKFMRSVTTQQNYSIHPPPSSSFIPASYQVELYSTSAFAPAFASDLMFPTCNAITIHGLSI